MKVYKKNISIFVLTLILFQSSLFTSNLISNREFLKKNSLVVSLLSVFTFFTIFFSANNAPLKSNVKKNKNNFSEVITNSDFIKNTIHDNDFFKSLQKNDHLQANFLKIPIMLYANKTLSKEKLEIISQFLIQSIPYLSNDINSEIFKKMYIFNKKFIEDNEQISFDDHQKILKKLLNTGVNINKISQNFETIQNDIIDHFSKKPIDQNYSKTINLFLNHGLFIKETTLNSLNTSSLDCFQKSFNNELQVLNLIEKRYDENKPLMIENISDTLCKSTARPIVWLLGFISQYEIPIDSSINLCINIMINFFDKTNKKNNQKKNAYSIQDTESIFTYINENIGLISVESKKLQSEKAFSRALGKICNTIIQFGYYQDENKYFYFKPLLVHVMENSNKTNMPNLTYQDSVEGTNFHMLARNVFDPEIINIFVNNYDHLILKKSLNKKKKNAEFKNEKVTCFDIAESSENPETKEIFQNLKKL